MLVSALRICAVTPAGNFDMNTLFGFPLVESKSPQSDEPVITFGDFTAYTPNVRIRPRVTRSADGVLVLSKPDWMTKSDWRELILEIFNGE